MKKVVILSFAAIVTDFFLRGLLWYPVQQYYGDAIAERVYYIFDSAAYLLLYLLIAELCKKCGYYKLKLVMWCATWFAVNKLTESIFVGNCNWDWTEMVYMPIALIYIYISLKDKDAL